MSAAQVKPVLDICPKCGAVNRRMALACEVCQALLGTIDRPLGPVNRAREDSAPAAAATPISMAMASRPAPTMAENTAAPAAPATSRSKESEWRQEVASRMESYRARRSRLIPGENQSALPFSVADAAPVYTAEGPADPQAEDYRASLRTTARPRRPLPPAGGIEISAEQPQLDFTAPEEITAHPSDVLVPVADLNERLRAGALDAGFLALSYGFFLALFASLGGRFAFAKADVLIYGVTFVLLYAAYFGLFSVLGPATPGMTLCGLTVVNFEGHPAQFRNLLWRSFGYLLSGGSLFLGYMWSLWDEDHLTWQDRISQTYVTYAVRYISPSTSSSV